MKGYYLTRMEMGNILQCIRNQENPQEILIKAWERTGSKREFNDDNNLPPIFQKLLKAEEKAMGLSINEIVSLGNQIEYASFRSTAVQNWVKRDIKDWIGSPQHGKKYSVEQAAILFIVEDLKNTHDFESIRLLLKFAFNNPADRNDDLINPLVFYHAYACLFEEVHSNNNLSAKVVKTKAKELCSKSRLTSFQSEAMESLLISSSLSVEAAYFQTMSKHHLERALR
ncbi:DUF1836 domain-containing protein [Guptibacillus algicola]|uniref:DUF1836 domain-containing protein n=1 Tax=Guptibacillus algicola TaxID=225844 RepID=UPI001CD5D1C8|nr:DUF1836 domain-containing protein [Alkalihalobacillus algicola]MCA0989103.1 DUF1836 domain-containing protein [Alkalihalobacillus algicola]